MLFRNEALNAQLDNSDGPIVLARSIPIWHLSIGTGVIALLILALLFFGEYTKRMASIGLLVPSEGAIRIVPPASGVVLETHVKEGQVVRKGEILFVVGDVRNALLNEVSRNLGETVSRNIQRKRQELERSRANEQLTASQIRQGESSKIEKLTLELGHTDREIALDHSRVRKPVPNRRAAQRQAGISGAAV